MPVTGLYTGASLRNYIFKKWGIEADPQAQTMHNSVLLIM